MLVQANVSSRDSSPDPQGSEEVKGHATEIETEFKKWYRKKPESAAQDRESNRTKRLRVSGGVHRMLSGIS